MIRNGLSGWVAVKKGLLREMWRKDYVKYIRAGLREMNPNLNFHLS